MSSFTQTYTIEAPVLRVWEALVDPDIIEEWGGGPAAMDAKVGTQFELWGGDVWGKNISVSPHKQLKQEWYGGEWDQPSIVTFDLSGNATQTTVVLKHEQVPDDEQKSLEDGWNEYYFGPMKKLLEKK